MKEKLNYKKVAPIVVIFGVILIPLLYSFFYLGAFWDPYSHLETVPVAVVNEDKGALINGEQRNLGDELCDELKKDATLKFDFTDARTAKAGTEGKEYYATITIPKDFSESIQSAETTEKHTATITYTSNEKRNYIASQILNSAIVKVQKSINSSINEELVTGLSDKLKSVPDELTDLSDGLDKLSQGAVDLKEGTSDLKTGAVSLQDGAGKLADGTGKLKSGSSTLVTSLADLSEGVAKLTDGSATLNNGISSFKTNMKKFNSSVGALNQGSQTLNSNMKTLDSALGQLSSGAAQLDTATKNIGDLDTGVKALASGASQLNTGLTTYTTGVNSLITNVEQTTKVLAAYAQKTGDPTISALVAKLTSADSVNSLTQLNQASANLLAASGQISAGATKLSDNTKNLSSLHTSISQLNTGLGSAKDGADQLAAGTTKLSDGMTKLDSGSEKLYTATGQISDGADKLSDNMNALQSGTDKIRDGAGVLIDSIGALNEGALSLKDGTDTLVTGANDLNDGAVQMKDGLTTAKDAVDTSVSDANDQLNVLDGLDKYAKNPVEVNTEPYAPVPNYGTSFAPYFMSLSLWVGGLMIFFGIYLDADSKFKLLSRNAENKVLRTFLYLLIGLFQSVILGIILLFGLNLKVNHIGFFFASCILVSFVFISIIQFLLIFLKDVGKFLSLGFLILQLTSCGGTFPMETVPKIFNDLYPFMPMTYSVGLFKEAISGVGNTSTAWHNVCILLIIWLVFMGATLFFTGFKKVRQGKLAEA